MFEKHIQQNLNFFSYFKNGLKTFPVKPSFLSYKFLVYKCLINVFRKKHLYGECLKNVVQTLQHKHSLGNIYIYWVWSLHAGRPMFPQNSFRQPPQVYFEQHCEKFLQEDRKQMTCKRSMLYRLYIDLFHCGASFLLQMSSKKCSKCMSCNIHVIYNVYLVLSTVSESFWTILRVSTVSLFKESSVLAVSEPQQSQQL